MADATFTIDVDGDAESGLDGIAEGADEATAQVEVLAARLQSLPEAKVRADIADLEYKLDIARAKLEGATGTYRVKLEADIGQMESQLASAKGQMMDFSRTGQTGLASMAMGWQGAAFGVAALSSQMVGLGAVAGVGFAVAYAGAMGLGDAIALLGQRTGVAGRETDELNRKIAAAFAQMSTGGQEFSTTVASLVQGPLKQLQISAQDGLFRGLSDGLKEATPLFRQLNPVVAEFSNKMGQLIGPMIPQLTQLTTSIIKFANASLDGLVKAGLGEAFAKLAEGLAKMFDNLVESGDAERAMEDFVKILEVTATVLPPLLELLLRLSSLFMAVQGPSMAAAEGLAAVFDILNKLLSLPGNLLSWVMGGGASSVSNLSIPGFAEGGVAMTPTLGVFGEAGPEALVPLDQMGNMGGGGGNTYVYNISGVIGPAASVVTAIRSANSTTQLRGYGVGVT